MRDYADAFMRYLRATRLVTFDSRSVRLTTSAYKAAEVEFLLKNVDRKPSSFRSKEDFQSFLFSPDTLKLLTDDRKLLIRQIGNLEAHSKRLAVEDKSAFGLEELKPVMHLKPGVHFEEVTKDTEHKADCALPAWSLVCIDLCLLGFKYMTGSKGLLGKA